MQLPRILSNPVYPPRVSDENMRKRIYCHRGLWVDSKDQNTIHAFKSAAKHGFGIETDLNHLNGQICVSHDIPESNAFLEIAELLQLEIPIALNLKCDGLLPQLSQYRTSLLSTGSFIFDGSIPEMHKYQRANFPHALRVSEFEKSLPWRPTSLWIDAFESEWWINEFRLIVEFGIKKIIFVSPELHGRNPEPAWEFLSSIWDDDLLEVQICTDKPFEFMDHL